jgi:biotin carboxyl carrier protein
MAGGNGASTAVHALGRVMGSTRVVSRTELLPRAHLLAWRAPTSEWITRAYPSDENRARYGGSGHPSSATQWTDVAGRGRLHTSTPSKSHDAEALDRGDVSWAITTPIISDQVSIPDGVVGDVVEIPVRVGDVIDEGTHAVIIETHKACLNVKATGHRKMRVIEILTKLDEEVKEGDRLLMVEKV